MDKGIIQFDGKMKNSHTVFGDEIKVTHKTKKNKVIEKGKRDIDDDLEAINSKLEDINSKLSKNKDSLDELVKKALSLEAELKEENPNKERAKRCLKELSLLAFQITGTANSLLQVLSGLK